MITIFSLKYIYIYIYIYIYTEILNVNIDKCCSSIHFFHYSFLLFFFATNELFVVLFFVCCHKHFQVSATSFSQEGLEGVDFQELNMGWQAIREMELLCGIIEVLVGQVVYTIMGIILLKTKVQFLHE
jgi:hypothetical protein